MGSKSETLNSKIKQLHSTVEELENNLYESRSSERKVQLCFHVDNLKTTALNNELKSAIENNESLLNILQEKSNDRNSSPNDSINQLHSSVSTMSIVHLQYKYEELLQNHKGLLRMLEEKLNEIHKLREKNERLTEELTIYKFKLEESAEKIEDLGLKLSKNQSYQKKKLDKLNLEKETLKNVHNQLATLLHEECMKKNEILANLIKDTQIPERAQLLKEVQKNNRLIFENLSLRQQNEYFKALLKLSKPRKRKIAEHSSDITNE